MSRVHGAKIPKKKNNPEGVIQKEILDYLKDLETICKKPIYYFRSGAGAVKTIGGGFFKTGRTGCPDITLVVSGKFVGLEVKDVGKYQKPEQKEAEFLIARAGGDYYVVRSVLEVKQILAKYIDIF